MCIICTDPNCDHGERCGRVKIYKEGGSASDLLDSRGEWEHVIPGAVIRGSVFLHSHGVTYRDSMTYALDYAIHRDAVDGSGGGITSTGRSEIAQGWVNDLIRLSDSGQSDEAIGKVFCDEVYAIEAHRKFTENDFSSLVAILRSYIDKGIVSQSKADEIASWMHGRI